jgi:hypothetical protein
VADPIDFRQELLPPLAAIEREWRELETVALPSFFSAARRLTSFLSGSLLRVPEPFVERRGLGRSEILVPLLLCRSVPPIPERW